jgi:hypothetical protein
MFQFDPLCNMFILGFNLVISVGFVTCGKLFAYVDTCLIETVETSKLAERTKLCKQWKYKNQIETFKT